ncbi:lipoprotein [Marinospirillum sp.]|nr:lipoprotein [Marinospirillum sp.]MDR9467592.1 lipoprotein [Marinospirillum sp.]
MRIPEFKKGLLLLLVLGLLLSGCGQRGDLYLPEPEQEFTSNF